MDAIKVYEQFKNEFEIPYKTYFKSKKKLRITSWKIFNLVIFTHYGDIICLKIILSREKIVFNKFPSNKSIEFLLFAFTRSSFINRTNFITLSHSRSDRSSTRIHRFVLRMSFEQPSPEVSLRSLKREGRVVRVPLHESSLALSKIKRV